MALNQNQINGASLSTSPERPLHYTYLKGFRVEQCALFLQHKCTNHKPYTCFDWHFQNQRRRRPVRRRDGTFNYSPDTYCTKYDEPTGMCPDKDDCPFLHKTAGDTERRYHLRYYKTSMCVYETDPRGYCSKNGKHCAFAHGPQDLRNPIFDVRELQTLENGNSSGELSDPSGLLSTSAGSASLDRERNALLEDPRWNDTAYVLANYKTELCTRPPRFCRQGYACPQYHNGKDRRRSPRIFRYRSTPCPNTKQGDEWVDPSKCEQGDQCPFCHSRTEQQFHPEIFKSTKCKDISDTSYCPRNAFCAFAHNDAEISTTRDIDLDNIDADNNSTTKSGERETLNTWLGVSFAEQNNSELPSSLLSSLGTASPNQSATKNTLGPIARPRSYSHSQAKSVNMESFNHLHAAIARARLIDEMRMPSYNANASSNNPIGFRERAVHSFSIPSATEATQLLFDKNSTITALDFLPSSRLSNLNLSRKDIDLGPLVTSSSPLSASVNQSSSLSPTVDCLVNKLELSANHLDSDLPVLPRELKEELQEDVQAELQNELRQEMHVNNQHQINGAPLSTGPERPLHYTYLKGFRVEQCALFLQHKCTNHKPYTCFDWHFQNQRRRRPVRRRDGTFNYSPDTYCTKYDETTGMCPDGDDCPFLHKTAGDTERRYHLRYYKTGMCVYETDSRGFCTKNGKHCAFAHGPQDLRNPVFDVRELQSLEANGANSSGDGSDPSGLLSTSAGSQTLDRERNALLEDPRWNDTAYVLANYKTELCTRPPRFCRQGYACPQYHNGKDRRRSPRIFRYRSTPCPNTKQGDEWVDPSKCEQGDQCPFCHSRTEQQFHPEIFKSTKCKDISDTGYCPRNAFCAFAHNDAEISSTRSIDLENIDTESSRPMKEMLDTWTNLIL